jgi:hypothetical protein
MSLINDALRRAQAAQQQPPPPPLIPVPPRPLEPVQHARHNLGLMVPVGLAMLALLALFFVWAWVQRGSKGTSLEQARALSAPAAPATIATPPAAPMVAVAPPSAQPIDAAQPDPGLTPAATSVADPPAAPAPATPSAPPAVSDQETEAAIPVAVTPPPPKPAPLRLQAILFNPKRPSAQINGKTLFIGDKLSDSRVVAIDQVSVTLVGDGKTNVLILPE